MHYSLIGENETSLTVICYIYVPLKASLIVHFCTFVYNIYF